MQKEFCHRKRRLYKGNGIGKFVDVLPDRLTLCNPMPGIFGHILNINETCFQEVARLPYKNPNPDFKEELESQNKLDGNRIIDLFNVTINIIEKNWNPKLFHVIGHSSGYDSRVLSMAIKKLYEKNGTDWLGDILFVETNGEGCMMEQIMQIEGWTQYYIHNKDCEPGVLHRDSFNGGFFGKYNGIGSYPVNQWYDAYMKMNKIGIIPREVQFFTGYGPATELFFHRGQTIDDYFKWEYELQLNLFEDYCEAINPFWDYEWMRIAYAYKNSWESPHRSNVAIIKTLFPELDAVPRLSVKEMRQRGYRTLDKNLYGEIVSHYQKTWFGKKHPINPIPHIDYNRWWGYYSIAELCEHLLERGYRIEYK